MRLPWLRNGDNRRRCRNNAYVTRAANYAKCNVYPRAWNGAMHLLFFWHRVYPLDDSASLLDDNTCPAAKLQTIVIMQSFFPQRGRKREMEERLIFIRIEACFRSGVFSISPVLISLPSFIDRSSFSIVSEKRWMENGKIYF